jgi:hypothetical protein
LISVKKNQIRYVNLVAGQRRVHYFRMAFRIHDSVVRGEIDNRVKGILRLMDEFRGRA